MREIAFIGDPWVGSVRRAEAFSKLTPTDMYDITFFESFSKDPYNMHTLDYTPVSGINVKHISEYDPGVYDLVMTMNDKHFDKVLQKYGGPVIKNMVDKNELSKSTTEFGLGNLTPDTYEDNDTVFVKPVFGAGQYTTNDFCYKSFKFRDLPYESCNDIYTIQKFIDCPVVISVTFVCNGNELIFIDVTEATHLSDRTGKNLNSHLISKIDRKDEYTEYIDISERFLKFIQYNKIPGVYMLQFMTDKNGIIYCNDFNVRSGPVSDLMTVLGFTHRIHNTIPFIIGDCAFDRVNIPHLIYQCYQEDCGITVSDRVITHKSLRLLVSDNKTSGIIRNDYDTYLEFLGTIND